MFRLHSMKNSELLLLHLNFAIGLFLNRQRFVSVFFCLDLTFFEKGFSFFQICVNTDLFLFFGNNKMNPLSKSICKPVLTRVNSKIILFPTFVNTGAVQISSVKLVLTHANRELSFRTKIIQHKYQSSKTIIT